MRIVEGSGAGVGGFRNDAGAFKGGDEATPWAEAVGEVIPQVQVGGGGMHDEAVVWCQFCTEGIVDEEPCEAGVDDGLGAITWASGLAFSSQWLVRSPNGCDGDIEEDEEAASAVAVDWPSSWWMWQARAGEAAGPASPSPEATRAVVNHDRPRRPARPCDAVIGFSTS